MKPVFSIQRGNTPLLVSIPHAGVLIPDKISPRLTSCARSLPDTDWFVERLYKWVADIGVGLLVANYSRYVIDLNRPSDDAALYARSGTGLLPVQTFAGEAVYRPGMQPDEAEMVMRLQQYWQPYHQQLNIELQAIQQKFGYVVLLDAHSIVSQAPKLFDGTLPDLNLGSNKGSSADPGLVSGCMAALAANPDYSLVLDGRFQGGYITRHYGCPQMGIHALQLEISQSTYMSGHPPAYAASRSTQLQVVLRGLVDTLINWSPEAV